MSVTPENKEWLKRSFCGAFEILWLGFREPFKHKNFLFFYLLTAFYLSQISNHVAVFWFYENYGRHAYALFIMLFLWSAILLGNVIVLQYILRKYRRITVNAYSLILCLAWAAAFMAAHYPVSYLVYSFSSYLSANYPQIYESLATLNFYRILDQILLAAVMIWVGFYPYLVLEGVRNPFRENIRLIKESGLLLATCWIVTWFCSTEIRMAVKAVAYYLIGHSLDDNIWFKVFVMWQRQFMVDAVIVLIGSSISVAAYLRATGEYEFMAKPDMTGLIKKKDEAEH